jgi:hypothetical protein
VESNWSASVSGQVLSATGDATARRAAEETFGRFSKRTFADALIAVDETLFDDSCVRGKS